MINVMEKEKSSRIRRKQECRGWRASGSLQRPVRTSLMEKTFELRLEEMSELEIV